MLRATMRSLLSRKLRLILSGLAVVLGVMFVSGAFVLTDTLGRSFDNLFQGVYSNVDVQVAATPKVPGGDFDDDGEQPANLPASTVDKVRAVPGVASATGVAMADGARLIGTDGKVVTSFGPPRLGVNWNAEAADVELREGRGPTADNEIAINASLAKAAGVHVGDQVGVLTLQPKKTFTLTGIFGYPGGKDSQGGTQVVAFTEPVAQRLMLGEPGVYSFVNVTAVAGTSPEQLRDAITGALHDPAFQVKTGQQLADEAADSFAAALSFFNNILLGFAGVALFVGVFLILNTFSIIVAQRTRELALMRALGGSRRQVIGAVLLEAVVIGLLASVIGLGLGIGVGALLAWVFGNTGGASLGLAGVGVPAAAVIGAFAVGILVTVVAALLPAVRASRVAPVAALQEAATPDRPLTKLTVAGGVVLAIGGTLLGLGLTGNAGDQTLWTILGGVLLSFIGAALLTPLVVRPVAGLIGRLFAWSVPGRLGRLNSGRNPRRTAITAAALMVGIALIIGINTVITSAKASFTKLADEQVKAELIISGEGGQLPPTFDPAVLEKAKAIPGVQRVSGVYIDRAEIHGNQSEVRTEVVGVSDFPALLSMFNLTATQGSMTDPGDSGVIVDESNAKDAGVGVGDTVDIQLSRGEVHHFKVAGMYDSKLFSGWLLPTSATRDFRVAQPVQGYVQLAPGASLDQVKAAVAALLADSPEVSVGDQSEFIDQQTKDVDTLLTMIQILLALAILIAVLGIVNTLALSMLERTRELGLLRAVGLNRAQTMRMVTVEAVVISVFGALLGLAVGTGLGTAVVQALHDEGITVLQLPWEQMGTYLVLAALVGVAAAVLPAIRAARVNVLDAIAYE